MQGLSLLMGHLLGDFIFQSDWQAANKRHDDLVCAWHCLLYTLACFLTCFWFLPWWSYPVILVTHFAVDRWGLARRWMQNYQEGFATGPLAPWSIVVVDNTMHLLVLWLVGMCA